MTGGHSLDAERSALAGFQVGVARLARLGALVDLVRPSSHRSRWITPIYDRQLIKRGIGLQHDQLMVDRPRVLRREGDIAGGRRVAEGREHHRGVEAFGVGENNVDDGARCRGRWRDGQTAVRRGRRGLGGASGSSDKRKSHRDDDGEGPHRPPGLAGTPQRQKPGTQHRCSLTVTTTLS